MKRPTIKDVAEEAGVSVSTVNRIIAGTSQVRGPTQHRVLKAAEKLGFYAVNGIKSSIGKQKETHVVGVLLLQGHRSFYKNLGESLQRAANVPQEANVELVLEFLHDLSPESVAARIIHMGDVCEAVAIVSADHPLVSGAIDTLIAKGVPVISLLSPLSSQYMLNHIGLNSWKAGRTAAWGIEKTAKEPGDVGILVGNHRFRNQEIQESGFRSYFREHNSAFTVLEPRSTYVSSDVARDITINMLQTHPDMRGLYVAAGGITGVIAALREQPVPDNFTCVCLDLFDATRAALIDGTLTMVINHPMEQLATDTIAMLVRAKQLGINDGGRTVDLNLEIYTSENI